MALVIWFLTVLGLYPSAVNAFFNVVNCKFNSSIRANMLVTYSLAKNYEGEDVWGMGAGGV